MKKVGLVLMLLMANFAAAGVASYDSFGYQPGALMGVDSRAVGFAGAWSSGGGDDTASVLASSLDCASADASLESGSGSLSVGSGGRIGRFLDLDENGIYGDYLNDNGNLGKPGTSIYLSFIMRTNNPSPFYAFELKRDDLGDNGAVLYIGNDIGGNRLQACAYRNRDQSEANIGKQLQFLGDATTDPELFVVRVDFDDDYSDDVTIYRNPSLDAEPNEPITLHDAGSMAFDALTMAAWVGPTVEFDELCVATTYEDAVRMYAKPTSAQNPTPANGSIDQQVASGTTLEWDAGSGIAADSYKVYLSEYLHEVVACEPNAYIADVAANSYGVNLATDSTYFWSVTQVTAEGVEVPGVVWQFDTLKTLPVVHAEPVGTRVFADELVELTFDVSSISDVYYQWYYNGEPLTNSAQISGVDAATLVINAVQVANEGSYYCVATNTAGSITSAEAVIVVNRIVAKWSLDYTDDTSVWSDISGTGNDLTATYTVPSSYTWATGADGTENGALVFDGTFALGTLKADGTMNAIPVANDPFTISIWFSGPVFSTNSAGLIGWGNFGNNNQCNALAMYDGNPSAVNNYWWDNDFTTGRGYPLNDSQWHQIVVAYDGTVRSIYIDGILAGSNNPRPHNVQTSENFTLGKANSTNDTAEFFNGAIDNVEIYNYAIDNIDVAYSYTDFVGGSLCIERPVYDYNNDCIVNVLDMAYIASDWLECNLVPDCIANN